MKNFCDSSRFQRKEKFEVGLKLHTFVACVNHLKVCFDLTFSVSYYRDNV